MYAPVTPGGTVCVWLRQKSEEKAWKALMEDAAHMPYKTNEDFIARGYTVQKLQSIY